MSRSFGLPRFTHEIEMRDEEEEKTDARDIHMDMDVSQNVWHDERTGPYDSNPFKRVSTPTFPASVPLGRTTSSFEARAPLLSSGSRSDQTPFDESIIGFQSSPVTTLHFGSPSETAWQSVQNGSTKYTSYTPESYYNSGFVKSKSILDVDPFNRVRQEFEMTELGLPMSTVQVEYEPPSLGETTRKSRGFWSRLFSRATPSSSPTMSSGRLNSLSATLFRPKKGQATHRRGCLARLWHWLPSPNPDQRHTLIILALQLCLALILYNVPYGEHIIYPFHLMGVLFHELGHASMAWLTGATVVSIRIGPQVDGATVMKGGSRCAILPAGYLGAAFAGSLLLFCGFSESASLYLSFGIDAFCILTIFLAADIFTFVATIVVLSLFILTVVFGGRFRGPVVRYTVCMMGVLASTFSCWDIVDDLIRRVVPESDAYKFATYCLYCPSAVVGVFWLLISCIFISFSVIMALKVFKTSRRIK